jgi:hypothetical protein
MPCDSITTQSVNLQNAMPSLVESALTTLGWNITSTVGTASELITARKDSYTFIWSKGEGITIKGMRTNENMLKDITREYSKQAVTWASQRAGWQVTTTGGDTLTVSRR